MSNDLFQHKYRLTIGQTNNSSASGSLNKSAVITGNHIDFHVLKTSDSKHNNLKLKIYNLTDSTIHLFDPKDVLIQLEVGYGTGELRRIFMGNKGGMSTFRENTEIITEIDAADGYVATREGRVTQTFPEGSSMISILNEIIEKGMPSIKSIKISPEVKDRQYKAGYSVIGSAKHNLDSICEAEQLEWHIVNTDTLNIFPKASTINNRAIILTPQTGLIETPEKKSQDIKQLKKSVGIPGDAGVKFRSLMNPLLEPGALIQLRETAEQDGNYKIQELRHIGRFEGHEWITEILAVAI